MLPPTVPDRHPACDPDSSPDETIAPLAHDLRDALTTVIGRAQLLTRRLTSDRVGPDEVVAGLTAIERAARRMAGDIERFESRLGPPSTGGRRGFLGTIPNGPAANPSRRRP